MYCVLESLKKEQFCGMLIRLHVISNTYVNMCYQLVALQKAINERINVI